jgi:hypothetical protein
MRNANCRQRGYDVLKKVLAGAAVGTIALVSCSTMAGASNASKAEAWAKQNHAGPIGQKVVQDAGAYVKGANASSSKKIIAACKALQRDVPAAQHLPPIPVPSFESFWSKGLADLSKGANSCLAAYTAKDENQIGHAKTLAEKGANQVNAGVEALQQLSNL